MRCQRLTLELKCAGLDAEQLARRSGRTGRRRRGWAAWREEVAFGEQYLRDHDDMDQTAVMRNGDPISFREVLVHMVEEYARHNGHADLLRERIDGRVGQ